jgi:protein TonB
VKYQTRAFQISFLLHSLILVVAILLSTFIGHSKKLMVMDFNLRKPEAYIKKVEPPAPTPVIKTKPIKPKARQTLTEKEPPRQPEEKPRISSSPEIPPMVKLPEAQDIGGSSLGIGMVPGSKSIKEGSPGTPGGSKEGSGTGSGLGNSDGGKESAKAKYLKEHFAYIRDKILKNINYPDMARRMGWQGKVLLSFIITADGSVREFKIIQSSGFTILDKSAIETVKDTAPFPKPPGEARLVIPIIYRLE